MENNIAKVIAKAGMLSLDKGDVRGNVKMYAWDGIRECHEGCPLIDECSYIHKGKCAAQVEYVQALYKAILSTYTYLDESMLFKIGMELIPLYVQLSRLQIVELSLESPMTVDEKGREYVHPVYKEIRDTLKTIQVLWKGMDMSFTFGEKLRAKREMEPGGKGNPKVIDYEKGDPSYHKKIGELANKDRTGITR